MKKLRCAAEAEVIAEFLKNEFHHPAFHRDREHFARLVVDADTSNEEQNALRRALLFRVRGHMWRELPPDTRWYQVQLEERDLGQLRVFPRAQWRKLATGQFRLADVVERIRSRQYVGKITEFVARVQSLSYRLRSESDCSSVMLIGMGDGQPYTIIEGNHRLTAALLASPDVLRNHFRVFCGLSPHMDRCCWYKTTLPNLWRYGLNRLEHFWYDPEADIDRVLPRAALAGHPEPYVEQVARKEPAAEPK
jgi:hypothetical protein